MIDAVPPSSQQIVQKMVECGVDRAGIVVTVDNEEVGIIIKVRREARVPADRIACIHQATKTAAVFFDDLAVRDAYRRYALDRSRPALRASAEPQLAKLGLIEGFPRRSAYADGKAYVRALERHGGFPAGSILDVAGEGVLVNNFKKFTSPADLEHEFKQMTTMIAVLMYATGIGDFDGMNLGGNAPAASSGQ